MNLASSYFSGLLLSALVATSWCYPNGAPDREEILQTMRPMHPFEPQTGPSPYQITVASNGNSYNFTLTGSEQYKGFLVEVRDVCGKQRIGTFAASTNSVYRLRGNGTAVTHFINSLKTSTVFPWTKPADYTGRKAYIYFTVVKQRDTFWVQLKTRLQL